MDNTRHASAVVIAVDGLSAALVGAYGNHWLRTPAIDQLASQSLVFDFAWLDSLDRHAFANSVFFGRHPGCPARNDPPGLGALLRNEGVDSLHLTDDLQLVDHPGAGEFTDCEIVVGDRPSHPADDIESTLTAQFFATCAERLLQMDRPALIWLQFRGLLDVWDAPTPLRELLADESDPAPPNYVDPVQRVLGPDDDPDIALGALQALAAQVLVVDSCLAEFLAVVNQHRDPQDTLVLLTSACGYALGEHALIGTDVHHLYSELLHVPLLVRTPAFQREPCRWSGLVQPPGIFGILADWFRLPDNRGATGGAPPLTGAGPQAAEFGRALSVAPAARALRVPAWYLIEPADPATEPASGSPAGPSRPLLFAKPDDRWDANDIAARCPDVLDRMRAELRAFEDAAHRHELDRLPELPIELVQPIR